MNEVKKVIVLQTDLKKDDVLINIRVDLIDFHTDLKSDHLRRDK
jgi:hypothetical protein